MTHPALASLIARLQAEMNEALRVGAFFNPEMFGAMLKAGDNPILRWRDWVAEVDRLLTGQQEELVGLGHRVNQLQVDRDTAIAERGLADAEVARLTALLQQQREALRLAERWLANCLPIVDLGEPRPLPVIAALLGPQETA